MIDVKRQMFVEKAKKNFDFLVDDFGYAFKGYSKLDWTDELKYENESIDRLVILSNQYHPYDYGFEIQLYRPSVSTKHADREFPIYKLKEDQDDEQEYLSTLAIKFRTSYESIIIGDDWISTTDNKDLNLKEDFEKELEKVRNDTLLSPEFRKKKLIIWFIRTIIAVVLYFLFWKYAWIKWTLLIYVPLNLFNLLSIFGWNYLLKKKIKKTKLNISEVENEIRELDNEY